jgi:hypothetical protein
MPGCSGNKISRSRVLINNYVVMPLFCLNNKFYHYLTVYIYHNSLLKVILFKRFD